MKLLVKQFTELIIDNAKNKLIELFETKKFNFNILHILLQIPKCALIYEDPLTMKISLTVDDICEEQIIHSVKRIIDTVEFYEFFSTKNELFNLKLSLYENNDTFDIQYDPTNILKLLNTVNISTELFQEYIETHYLFTNIFIDNNQKNYFVNNGKPKLLLSLNGKIYNRPDREYYIVIESPEIYNIQVYKLNSNNKREIMLFGIWVDINNSIISEPFFIL